MNAPTTQARTLAATRGLALAARQLVAGAMAGIHPSRQPGLAREFSQYRAYQPGDDPRHIDWRLFARSDRWFVRESEIETSVAIRLVLDATESMRQADAATGVTKFECARVLAAAFALLAQAQGDPVGLYVIGGSHPLAIAPVAQRRPFDRIVHALEPVEPGGRWPPSLPLMARTTRELAIVLTDGHEHAGEIRAALAPLQARQHEILLVHLLTAEEVEFPFEGPVRFEEWETGATLETDAGAAREGYLAAHAEHLRAWRSAWPRHRFEFAAVRIDEPLDRSLRAILLRRLRNL